MSHFSLDYQLTRLPLNQPFTIARGTKESVENVIVSVTADGITGYGEAAPNKRYDEDAHKVSHFLDGLSEQMLDKVGSVDELSNKLDQAEHVFSQSMKSAKSAVEMAYLDWWGKNNNQPLWKLWKTDSNKTPTTSYTIGLDSLEVMQQKVENAVAFPILKVKLGTDRDREIIKGIRQITDKPIRVDANEGWTTLEKAKQQIAFLASYNIELVEQPMPASTDRRSLQELKQWSPLPLMADESFKGEEDLNKIEESFNGINIKLAKIGSLVKAREVIKQAQGRNLEIMIGCMIESTLAISGGALLGTYADYVDLDGNLLIANDPFMGLDLDSEKRVILSTKGGLGVRPRPKRDEK